MASVQDGIRDHIVVLKMDIHCSKCAAAIRKKIKRFEGVEGVVPNLENDTVTVLGRVDAAELRERTERKIHKTVLIVSAARKEEKEEKEEGGKRKESSASSVLLRIPIACNCAGCRENVRKMVLKTKGMEKVEMVDEDNSIFRVTGKVDMVKLQELLRREAKTEAQIVSLGKEKEAIEDVKDQQGKENPEEITDEKAVKKNKKSNQGDIKKEGEMPAATEARMKYHENPNGEYYRGYPPAQPSFFSDENPNGCSIM